MQWEFLLEVLFHAEISIVGPTRAAFFCCQPSQNVVHCTVLYGSLYFVFLEVRPFLLVIGVHDIVFTEHAQYCFVRALLVTKQEVPLRLL
ncbi:MAG: hypothetical protein UU89_C0039G0003 [Parcubacteria group bacterium GW2011_GWC2_42_11]|nr:MAG: hypothetical protein UU89_C0039G0003 [Parcubacteria group bacterium GW2011_GWC2_42_11]